MGRGFAAAPPWRAFRLVLPVALLNPPLPRLSGAIALSVIPAKAGIHDSLTAPARRARIAALNAKRGGG